MVKDTEYFFPYSNDTQSYCIKCKLLSKIVSMIVWPCPQKWDRVRSVGTEFSVGPGFLL